MNPVAVIMAAVLYASAFTFASWVVTSAAHRDVTTVLEAEREASAEALASVTRALGVKKALVEEWPATNQMVACPQPLTKTITKTVIVPPRPPVCAPTKCTVLSALAGIFE